MSERSQIPLWRGRPLPDSLVGLYFNVFGDDGGPVMIGGRIAAEGPDKLLMVVAGNSCSLPKTAEGLPAIAGHWRFYETPAEMLRDSDDIAAQLGLGRWAK